MQTHKITMCKQIYMHYACNFGKIRLLWHLAGVVQMNSHGSLWITSIFCINQASIECTYLVNIEHLHKYIQPVYVMWNLHGSRKLYRWVWFLRFLKNFRLKIWLEKIGLVNIRLVHWHEWIHEQWIVNTFAESERGQCIADCDGTSLKYRVLFMLWNFLAVGSNR